MTDLSKMNKLINKLSDEPFRYGKSDCFTFTAKLVKEWHGKDYLPLHIKAYKSEKTAAEYMARFGGIELLTTGTLGYPCRSVDCLDGDVVIGDFGDAGIALGFVYDGNGYFKGKKKVLKLPLKKCLRGWRIR
jgi:hypothetical protein